DVVNALGRGRLAEVAVGQPVGADVLDEVAGDAPGSLAIGVAAGVDGGQREAVQRPGLSAGPAGAGSVALSARLAHARAGVRVQLDDVAGGAVGADERAQRRVRVDAGGAGEARVAGLARGPEE